MNAFTIKDLENLTGIKAHTIRIWEQRYSFLKPHRTETNIRYYSNNELKVVLNIALLNKYGFKISHLDKMDDDEIKSKVLSLNSAEAQQEALINKMISHTIELEMDEFENLLNNQIKARGIEVVVNQLIFPFLQKIGMLWLTAHINPAQEHLVSNIIRQKLVVAIDQVKSPVEQPKTVLLFLPESEFHELGLLYVSFLYKSRGFHVIYLGANVPLNDLVFICKEIKPDFIQMHLTISPAQTNMEKYFLKLSQSLPGFQILVSGLFTKLYKKALPENILFKYSISEVLDYSRTIL